MNDEIKLPKEIEEAFNCIDYELSVCNDELPKILDYITNLQHTIKDNEDTLIDKNECIDLLETQLTNLQQENQHLEETIIKLNADKRGMLVQLYKANDNRDKVKQENERLKEEKQRLLYNLEKVCEENNG